MFKTLSSLKIFYEKGSAAKYDRNVIIRVVTGLGDGSVVKNPPVTQETWTQSLGGVDPLEEEMATHFSILAWRIPWTENLAGYSPKGHKESDMTEATEQASDTKGSEKSQRKESCWILIIPALVNWSDHRTLFLPHLLSSRLVVSAQHILTIYQYSAEIHPMILPTSDPGGLLEHSETRSLHEQS